MEGWALNFDIYAQLFTIYIHVKLVKIYIHAHVKNYVIVEIHPIKDGKVCIKTRSPPASLPLKGQVTDNK